MSDPAPLYPVSRRHLEVLTDDVAIMQHAVGRRPDPGHGYCSDDVARALQVDLLHGRALGWPAVSDRAWRNMAFLEAAFDPDVGRFRNFRRVDGSWLDGVASEDCQGRVMHALGETIGMAPDRHLVDVARTLFSQALPAAQRVTALRALASVLLGCDAAVRAAPSVQIEQGYRGLVSRLGSMFLSCAYSPEWPWPESRLTYENALPVRALIVAGAHLDARSLIDVGSYTLDWLIATQTAEAGHFSPVGNGWWVRGGEKTRFDQQPIEATALLLAAESAYEVDRGEAYGVAMERAYAWFLGANDLGIEVADPERGASGDGLTPDGVNANEGAESTLMWLTALEHMRAHRTAASPDVPMHDPVPAAVRR